MNESSNTSVSKLRTLTLTLIFSGALNVVLIAFVVLSGKEEISAPSIRPLAEHKNGLDSSINRFFAQIKGLSFHELVPYLTNRDGLDDGYCKRDVALASLVHFHYFHLEKALAGAFLQKRVVSFDSTEMEMFPGLTEQQFQAVIRFAYEEKWPLTAEGLYRLLKLGKDPKEPTLVQAFFVTPEFHALQVLLPKVDSGSLFNLSMEGGWDLIHGLFVSQQQMLDLSLEKKREFLTQAVRNSSKTAASLLLASDFLFVAKKLEDQTLLLLLSLVGSEEIDSEKLCMELLRSPRSDEVWTAACQALYRFRGEEYPSSLDVHAAIAKIIPQLSEVEVAQQVAEKVTPVASRHHVVKEGETLWKIGRLYNVKANEIAKLNELDKDRLHPGMTLKIPTME